MSKLKKNEDRERKIKLCIEAINNKKMSYSEAALCYNIPKTTIFCRLKGINGAAGVGRPRAISQPTERLIVELVQFMSDIGFSLKRNDILTVVENYLKESKQTHLFKTGKPTLKWYNSFIKKYAKNICERKATSMLAVRVVSSQPAIIDEWFSQVDAVYRENNLNKKPIHVFNCDESGLKFNQGKVSIRCRKGIKNPKQLAPTNEKLKIENCFSGKSTDSQVSLDKTNKISSKNSMNRLSTKEVLLKELDSIKNAVKQASFDINKSVLSVLKDRLKPLSSSKEKGIIIKRTSNYDMTELFAMAQDEATQAAKKRKLDEKEARKVIRKKKNWTQQFSKNKSLKKEEEKL